jgi:hypothetical protein
MTTPTKPASSPAKDRLRYAEALGSEMEDTGLEDAQPRPPRRYPGAATPAPCE